MASKSQTQTIKTLVRRANRRIERAQQQAAGQARALLHYAGGAKFSAATKGMSERQAQAYIEKLERFLGAESTTRRGWEKVKKENVKKAAATLEGMGYDIDDEELAEILVQIDASNKQDFYRAINLVQAEKEEAGDDWTGSKDQIADAIASKASAQQALQRALEARQKAAKAAPVAAARRAHKKRTK